MGIKSLTKFLRDNYPEIFEIIHISQYGFKRVAIDTSLYLCNFKALYGEEGWLGAFVKLISCLRENEIHCVFIYDSGFPPEKEEERKQRMTARQKLEERISSLEEAIETYEMTGEITKILLDFNEKKTKELKQKSMLNAQNKQNINMHYIKFCVKKMRKGLFSISKTDFQTTKELFDILKVPYFDAPLEAETTCADLCIQGKVDAVLTEDTDVLAYEAPVFLTKLNTNDGTCVRIKYSDVLEKVKFTSNQFLDFCIMCGTDYNKNIYKVGPSKALKLIEKYETIEKVGENMDISILNHKRVRELFREYKKFNNKVPYCGEPDFQSLQKFLFQKNLTLNVDSLEKSFVRNIIIFEDEKENLEK